MIGASVFVNAALRHGLSLWTGVPCSYLQPFINYVIAADDVAYVPASNEGDAVAIAAGYQIGGGCAVVMCQNSGLGNAVNPLTSLTHTHRIPILLIITMRGEPGGVADEPQHELMGEITTALLDSMQIPWEYFPTEEEQVAPCLSRALSWMHTESRPYCLLMRKGSVEAWSATSRPREPRLGTGLNEFKRGIAQLKRRDVLRLIQEQTDQSTILLATTGYTGRELYALADLPNQLYLVGAMGCASSVALGLAIARPELRIVVLDGDGALLMRMGALATIGFVAPSNLVHVLLDNGLHESTGGQLTVSESVDIEQVAAACGYASVHTIFTAEDLLSALQTQNHGPFFARVRILPGVAADLPRPDIGPVEVTQRLRDYLSNLS